MTRPAATLCHVLLAILVAMALGSGAGAREREAPSVTFEHRQGEMLRLALEHPFPKTACPSQPDPGNACIWGKLGYGIAALKLARTDAEIASGNSEISEALARIAGLPRDMAVAGRTESRKRAQPVDRLTFFTAGLLERIYFQFRKGGTSFPGRLSPDNTRAIETLMWNHARNACRLSDANPAKTWDYKESENIGLFRSTTCWGMAEILAANPICTPCNYEDGSTLQQQLTGWTKFLTEYIRQRAKYGGLVEFFSPTYYKYTLQNFYNLADFASEPELRRLASAFLDVWWAEWAEEQVGGWHGGSKARVYAKETEGQTVGMQLGWLYFGLGQKIPPGMMVSMIASSYRPPHVVNEIATDVAGRGDYVVQARAGGLVAPASNGREIDAAAGGVVRYAYVTPAFILSLAQIPKVSWQSWIGFSRQNRWGGATLIGPGRPKYVFARPVSDKDRGYNDLWGVQSFGTQIVQKIPAPLSRTAGRMAISISDGLKVEREGDWSFVDWGEAYVAFRPAFGGIAANNPAGEFILNNDASPVIIQAAAKAEFRDFASFKSAVRSAPLETAGDYIRFRGLGKAGVITFFHRSDRVPEIDGRAIDLSPSFALESPFLHAQWGEGIVSIRKGEHEAIRDFR